MATATDWLKPVAIKCCLLALSAIVGTFAQSSPPTSSDEPAPSEHTTVVIPATVLVSLIVFGCVIISVCCCCCCCISIVFFKRKSSRSSSMSSFRGSPGECDIWRNRTGYLSIGPPGPFVSKPFISACGPQKASAYLTLDDLVNPDISTPSAAKLTYPSIYVGKMSYDRSLVQSGSIEFHGEMDVSHFLYKEKYFDKNGGVLVLPEADVSLTIPPGAITDGCIISINVVPTTFLNLPGQGVSPRLTPVVICEPDGLNFEKPVELILPHCGIINDPEDHNVSVHFGEKEKYLSRDMKWKVENAEYKLTRRFCHIFLKHFSGVHVSISGTNEKILRAIPFAPAVDNEDTAEDLILNMWFCNNLASDYLLLVKNEMKNNNIPLDSYDTFVLNSSEHQSETYIEVTTDAIDGTNWFPETNTKRIDIHGLTTTAKSKCSFRYENKGNNIKDYLYVTIKVHQQTDEDERETIFVLRKRMADLTPNSCCLKADSAFLSAPSCLSDSGRPSSENPPKSCTVVPFVDPMVDDRDDIILNLWLLSEEPADQILPNFEEEQYQLAKIKLDTENTFTIRDARKPISSTIRFRKGNWNPTVEEMEVEIGKILCGNRTKYPFICRKQSNGNRKDIDVEIIINQKGEAIQTEFLKKRKVEEFFFASMKPVKVGLLNTIPPGEAARKFETLCQSLTDRLSQDDCHSIAIYFDFRPRHIDEVLSSDCPGGTLMRELRHRLLFTPDKLGWFQNALMKICRNDLAETIKEFKIEIQVMEGGKA